MSNGRENSEYFNRRRFRYRRPSDTPPRRRGAGYTLAGSPVSTADDFRVNADDWRYDNWRGEWRHYYASDMQRIVRGRLARKKAAQLRKERARLEARRRRRRINPHADSGLTDLRTVLRPNRLPPPNATFRPIAPAPRNEEDELHSIFRYVPGHHGSHRADLRRRYRR